MVFEPEEWDVPQQLVVYALEDSINAPSPYSASFNTTVSSVDMNFDQVPVPDYNLTVEDNDEGMLYVEPWEVCVLCLCCFCFIVFEDEAVLSGSLVWKEASADYPRTTAMFTLSLALSPVYYSNSSVGDTVYMPGHLTFGDSKDAGSVSMEVI